MAENHTFIDRDGNSYGPEPRMVEGWKEFFKMFPGFIVTQKTPQINLEQNEVDEIEKP